MTRKRLGFRAALVIALVVASLAAAFVRSSEPAIGAAAPVPGMAGTDISLPLTSSAVTARGRGQFAGMEVTVNQTRDITNQAVSLTWKGAAPTVSSGNTTFYGNFLQIMQCWGDPDGEVPENPGPPPENCEFGGLNATASTGVPGFASSAATSRQRPSPTTRRASAPSSRRAKCSVTSTQSTARSSSTRSIPQHARASSTG
jgi:hypothetical protein